MKKNVLLVLATAFMFSLAVMAQDEMPPRGEKGPKKEFPRGESPEINPQKRAERMAKEFKLTDDQKAKLQALFEKQAEKQKERRSEMEKKKENQKADFEKERKAMDEELQSIIGKENFEKMQAMREKRMEKRDKKMEHHHEGAPDESK